MMIVRLATDIRLVRVAFEVQVVNGVLGEARKEEESNSPSFPYVGGSATGPV